jgi:hypothetical protein
MSRWRLENHLSENAIYEVPGAGQVPIEAGVLSGTPEDRGRENKEKKIAEISSLLRHKLLTREEQRA